MTQVGRVNAQQMQGTPSTERAGESMLKRFGRWALMAGRAVLALATGFLSETVIWALKKWDVSTAETSPEDRLAAMQQIQQQNQKQAEKYAFPQGIADYVELGYVETKMMNHSNLHFKDLSEDFVETLRTKVYRDIASHPSEVDKETALGIIKKDSKMLMDSFKIAKDFKADANEDDALFVYETLIKADDCMKGIESPKDPKVMELLKECIHAGKRLNLNEEGLTRFTNAVLDEASELSGCKADPDGIKQTAQLLIDSLKIAKDFKANANEDDAVSVYNTLTKANDCLRSIESSENPETYMPKVVDFLRSCSLMGKRLNFDEAGLPKFTDAVLEKASELNGYKADDFKRIFNSLKSNGYFEMREAIRRKGEELSVNDDDRIAEQSKPVLGLEYSMMGLSAFFAKKVGEELNPYEKALFDKKLPEDIVNLANKIANDQISWFEANF